MTFDTQQFKFLPKNGINLIPILCDLQSECKIRHNLKPAPPSQVQRNISEACVLHEAGLDEHFKMSLIFDTFQDDPDLGHYYKSIMKIKFIHLCLTKMNNI